MYQRYARRLLERIRYMQTKRTVGIGGMPEVLQPLFSQYCMYKNLYIYDKDR
jgi:hypothetical protein